MVPFDTSGKVGIAKRATEEVFDHPTRTTHGMKSLFGAKRTYLNVCFNLAMSTEPRVMGGVKIHRFFVCWRRLDGGAADPSEPKLKGWRRAASHAACMAAPPCFVRFSTGSHVLSKMG